MKQVTLEDTPRVLMVLSYFHPFRAGAENQALLLSEQLCRTGAEVSVLTRSFKHLPDFETIGSVPVYRHIRTVNARTLFGLRYFWSCFFYMAVKRKHYDILHCHILEGFHSAAAVIAGRVFNKKVVIKIANTGAASDFLQIKNLIGGKHILRLVKKADVLVATSRQSAREALAEGCADSQIALIPNGVDTVRFRPSDAQAQARTRIVCAGRLAAHKGLDILLDAVGRLKRDGMRLRVDIAGQGPERGNLLKKTAACDLAGDVTLHGEIGSVEAFFEPDAVFVQPSRAEGMSNVMLEAMAAGLPVIATRTGAAPDVIQDGVNGMLVDAGSVEQLCAAVKKIISDEALARRLGASARRTIVENYSITSVAEKYMELYRGLAAPRSMNSFI